MPIEKAELFDILIVFIQELKKKMTDAETPGKVTKTELFELLQVVGTKAFQEALD
jgi:hypothetical protein